jgi:hypothetical protein
VDQLLAVAEVQADRGFLEDVEVSRGLAALALFVGLEAAGELGDELEALGLATGERGAALAEREVAEAGLAHERADVAELVVEIEEVARLLEGHLEDVGDVLALPRDLEGLGVVAAAAAGLAGDEGVGHEVHLDLHAAGAGAGLAASARGVEGETAGCVTADFGLRDGGEELADQVEDAEVGGRRGARRVADWGLVDLDDGLEDGGAGELIEWE